MARRITAAHLWTVTAGAALVANAWWLRSPSVRYLALGVGATGLAALAALRLALPVRRWALAAVATTAALWVLAWRAQYVLERIDGAWPAYRASLLAQGEQRLTRELDAAAIALHASALRALDAPPRAADAFDALERAVRGHAERGLVLYRRGAPAAWAGHIVTATDTLVAPIGAAPGPFYVTLYAAAERGDVRAVATAVVYAEPPGDSLTAAIANRIARDVGLHGFVVASLHAPPGPDDVTFAPAGDTVLRLRAVTPEREEARLLALEHARLVGTTVLGIALLLVLVAVWRHERTLGWRVVPLGVILLAVALAPLSTLSARSVLFDPTVYYAEVGGPFTANIGALGIAAAAVLLGVLVVLRTRRTKGTRGWALAALIAVVGGGPLLLRAMAAGVSPPPGGVTNELWVAWEIALCLTATSLFVVVSWAGATLLGGRGLPPVVAPAIAIGAALVGPLVLEAPARWPVWYPVLWAAAMVALALTRAHRRRVVTAALVAAVGAGTLTWAAGVRGRIALAARDIAGLGVVQPDVVNVLLRFGDALGDLPDPTTQAALVRAYMASDLLGSGYPAAMQSWVGDSVSAQVLLDPVALPDSAVRDAVAQARATGSRTVHTALGTPGMDAILAVPHADGGVTTVIVAPRTRLIPEDPFHALLGIEAREHGLPPYTITLVELDSSLALQPGQTRWYRAASALHGDHAVRTAAGPQRAHIEIELRALGGLIERGVLIVLIDLAVVGLLWIATVAASGAAVRWVRVRTRRWGRSYQARLTVVLFAFFVMPAAAFALWSYQRLQTEDRQARELLVREALRSYAAAPDAESLATAGARAGLPLFFYTGGELRQTSEPLIDALAPTGRFLPRAVYRMLRDAHEVYETRSQRVGIGTALIGYLLVPGGPGTPRVVAAPARSSDLMLDERRQDLGVLVLFVTLLGAIGALGLSRIASRSLAEPIDVLRGAALAIAGGEREPPLAVTPPEEFQPVFSAFRRMAADLAASRTALEAAQRRTAAVLRNVASGVVAVAPDGTVLLANPRAVALLAHPLVSGSPITAAAPDVAERLHRFLERGADEEDFELAVRGRQLQARFTRLAGGEGGAVLTLDDVTDLARAQRVLAWGEMARQVAHEIKNPLTPIRLGVQHLQRAYAGARGDFDRILDQNARRILAEIDRLDEIARSFSRYGTAPAERQTAERVDVASVVRDVVELERLGRDGVAWRLAGAEQPLYALARTDELREVLLNVLENARLAGASRVDVRCDRRDGEGRVLVEIVDDGRGIPAAVLPRIFEPHFSTRTSGSGLGLAISRQLVESWGGEIAIASEEGHGTSVRVELREERADGAGSDRAS